MMRLRPFFLLFLLLMTACAMPGLFEDEATPTAPPQRPAQRSAIHESVEPDSESLAVMINQIEVLDAPADPDVQILAVLTDGSGQTAYLLYPSNQPGVPEERFSLEEYPLYINSVSQRAGLWILALRHTAYPVIGDEQIGAIAATLANGFDDLYAPVAAVGSPVALIVDSNQEVLLEWFGEIEVLGEMNLPLSAEEPVEAKTVSSRDHGLRITYTFGTGALEVAQSATPMPTINATLELTEEAPPVTEAPETPEATETPDPNPSSISFEGYRRVIHDDFEGNQSSVVWFTIQQQTYTMLYSGGAYAIDLFAMRDEDDGVQSWGSIQDLYFNNYIVRAKMRFVQTDIGGSLGLWLNYRNPYAFISFAYDTSGEFRIGRFQDRYTDLIPWTPHPALNPPGMSNEFVVKLEQNTYTLEINGEPIPTVTDDPGRALQSGRIGFYCYAEDVPATCLLEEIEIWIPEDAPYPVTSPFPDAIPTPTP